TKSRRVARSSAPSCISRHTSRIVPSRRPRALLGDGLFDGSTLGRVISRGFRHHLDAPLTRGHVPADAATGAAGGAACGDVVRLSVAVDGERVADAGF